ncbi:MAG: hypothetical protein V8R80_07190 [Eubacterium sp.]
MRKAVSLSITSAESILPEMKRLVIDMAVSILLILALTAGVMTIWIYKGTTNPLQKASGCNEKYQRGKP